MSLKRHFVFLKKLTVRFVEHDRTWRALERALAWVRGEAVLCIAAICAIASMIVVPPDSGYGSYFDTRVLILLFCLMATVAGLKQAGLFDVLARVLLQGNRSFYQVLAALIMLPFFASMLVTNDVALLAFVPFAVLVLTYAQRESLLVWVVVFQAVAANLGGMAMPMGNPQNLFIFSSYQVALGDFIAVLLPYVGLTFAGLLVAIAVLGRGSRAVEVPLRDVFLVGSQSVLHGVLFMMCLLAVVRVLDPLVLLGIVVAVLLLFDRRSLRSVDYGLLLTFVCFFVFAGNVGRIDVVRDVFEWLIGQSALLTSFLASQVISNVPSAVLLSEFTTDWQGLLLGVDIGGLGTPIASLASLIALRLYVRAQPSGLLRFMKAFTLVNVVGIAAMFGLYACLNM